MADDKAKPVNVPQHMRALPGIDKRTSQYMKAIEAGAKSEGLDDKAAFRIALAFLKAYRPRNYPAVMDLAKKLGLV